jgi:hypothetical protein
MNVISTARNYISSRSKTWLLLGWSPSESILNILVLPCWVDGKLGAVDLHPKHLSPTGMTSILATVEVGIRKSGWVP